MNNISMFINFDTKNVCVSCSKKMFEIINKYSISDDKLISLIVFDLDQYMEDIRRLGPRIYNTCLVIDDNEVFLNYKVSYYQSRYSVYLFGSEKNRKVSA